jgi:hypothetical protein
MSKNLFYPHTMRGQLIVIRDVNGFPLLVRLWETVRAGVFIHSEEEWEKRKNGQKALEPVGFPYEDVFEYDNATDLQLRSGAMDWGQLRPFRRPEAVRD